MGSYQRRGSALLEENWPKVRCGLPWEAVAVFASACHWFLDKKGPEHSSSMGSRAGIGVLDPWWCCLDGAAERSYCKMLQLQGAERGVFELEVMLWSSRTSKTLFSGFCQVRGFSSSIEGYRNRTPWTSLRTFSSYSQTWISRWGLREVKKPGTSLSPC